MHQIDLPAEIARLRQLGSDFEDLHSEIRSLALTPGTDARQQLTAKIVDTNELVHQAMFTTTPARTAAVTPPATKQAAAGRTR
ncbi:hypothetical protein ACQEV4_15160 [Streptomyces shenzhenensis]|uniref:hypothetical protein n=1 Tax=Streptomyces shenzhenensis TaxID=943815 RepID=UPI003D936BC3